MTAAERRRNIMRIMFKRRYEKIEILASEFNVSERTIRRDISILSEENNPIYTMQGRYYGGVYITEGCYNNMLYITQQEKTVLQKAYYLLKNTYNSYQEVETLSNIEKIIEKYSMPQNDF